MSNNALFKFEFGFTLKDQITGYEGIVIGVARYVTGCDQYLLTRKLKKDDSETKSSWFDDNRLRLVKGKQIVLEVDSEKPGACDQAPMK